MYARATARRRVQDMARVIAFFASDDSGLLTGTYPPGNGRPRMELADQVRRLASLGAALVRHAALQSQHLLGSCPAPLREIVRQRRRGSERAHFVPRALDAATTGSREALAGRRVVEEQRHLREHLRLIELDHEERVAVGLPDLLTPRVLPAHGIPPPHPAPERHHPSQVRGHAQFRLGLLLGQLLLSRRRRSGFPPHPPFAPALARFARRRRRPNGRRATAPRGSRAGLCRHWPSLRSPPPDRPLRVAPTVPAPSLTHT